MTSQEVLNYYEECKYDLNDYSYTKIDSYLEGQPSAKEVVFEWEYDSIEKVKEVTLKISLNHEMNDAICYTVSSNLNSGSLSIVGVKS